MRLPPSPHRSRRFLAALALPVVVVFAVTGCTAPAASPTGASDTSAADTGSHQVEHARGETEVPDDVQRVVVLEPVQLDTTVALGVIPVGAAVLNEAAGVPPTSATQRRGSPRSEPCPNRRSRRSRR